MPVLDPCRVLCEGSYANHIKCFRMIPLTEILLLHLCMSSRHHCCYSPHMSTIAGYKHSGSRLCACSFHYSIFLHFSMFPLYHPVWGTSGLQPSCILLPNITFCFAGNVKCEHARTRLLYVIALASHLICSLPWKSMCWSAVCVAILQVRGLVCRCTKEYTQATPIQVWPLW